MCKGVVIWDVTQAVQQNYQGHKPLVSVTERGWVSFACQTKKGSGHTATNQVTSHRKCMQRMLSTYVHAASKTPCFSRELASFPGSRLGLGTRSLEPGNEATGEYKGVNNH